MYQCNIEISIQPEDGKVWTIRNVALCEIFKSADVILDSCRFILPLGMKWDGKLEVPAFEKSWVSVRMGYGDYLYPVFFGWVTYMQFDSKITFWCSGELAKYKYRNLRESNCYGFSFPDILREQGVSEKIVTDMRDKPWYFEMQQGSVFGLFEKLKRMRIHCSLITDHNEDSLFVISRRYPVALDRGRSFKRGYNIIDFKDALVKNDLADDIQFNVDATISKQLHVVNAEGKPDIADAVIAISWPEWRGRRIDLQFFGIDWDNEAAQEVHDAAIRSCVVRGQYELARLVTFGANFVEPYEKVTVEWLDEVSGEYVVVSNKITFGLDGIRQSIKLFS